KNMCMFCHKMQAKIVRYLELIHSEEDDVRKFKYLPSKYEGQSFIPCRRARENKPKILKNYLACGNCKGFYLKSTLRHHFRRCTDRSGHNIRVVKVMGRRLESKCLKEVREGCRERRKIIDTIRKKGNFEFNIKKQIRRAKFYSIMWKLQGFLFKIDTETSFQKMYGSVRT
ncbi:hypothetical protein ALC56_12793, partial [Trachymyrmex septentrionalis]